MREKQYVIRTAVLIIGMVLGAILVFFGEKVATMSEVSHLPAPFKLFGEQGVEMFSTSCGIPKKTHSFTENSADSSLFKEQYEALVAQANDSAEVVWYEFSISKNQLVFVPTCQGSVLVYFYHPQENKIKVVLVEKKGWFEYEYKKSSQEAN